MDDTEDLARQAAEAIMQRVNDTYPRTLHKDVLVDEIAKVIREVKKRRLPMGWPPAPGSQNFVVGYRYQFVDQQITASHDAARKALPDLP